MMYFWKRGMISIERRPKKSLLLLSVIFLLGILISATISISKAIGKTEENILKMIPPITIITATGRESDDFNPELMLSAEIIQEIAKLPQVYDFDFLRKQRSITSHELIYWEDDNEEPRWVDPDMGIELSLRAVQNPKIGDVNAGLIKIIEGRHFSEEEMVQLQETIPVVIADTVAEANHLTIGSTFKGENIIWPFKEASFPFVGYDMDRSRGYFASESYTFKVIGIFENVSLFNEDTHQRDKEELQNRIYIPMVVAQQMETFHTENIHLAFYEISGENTSVSLEEDEVWRDNYFILNDWREFESFKKAIEDIIPPGFHAADFSYAYRNVLIALEQVKYINNLILWGGIGSTLTILSLLSLLSLVDRRHEIGLYLSLGEKKIKIMMQLFLEFLLTSFVGITIALFIGNALGDKLSTRLFLNELAQQPEILYPEEFTPLNYLFNVSISRDVTQESYQVILDAQTVVIIYLVGTLTIILSMTGATVYLFTLKPKKILM